MRFISTRAHGAIDYLMGMLLIAAPWLFGFAAGGAETYVPVFLGCATIVYSLLTDYELGVARAIPMPTHLWLDVISGLLLAISPWLFGFAALVWVPHLILGLVELCVVAVSQTQPSDEPIRMAV